AVERKIIRDADITMEVQDVEKSYDNILAALAQYNGYEASRDMNSDSGGLPRISSTLKVPADKLDTFMGDIQKEGKLISSSISSSDITDQYYDSQTRLTNLEKTLDKYYEFLANAKTVDEQLQVTNYINDLTTQIEQLKGSLQRWDSQVSYSTVTLSLYRPYEAPKPERVIKWSSLSLGDMGWLISSGFVKVCNGIFSVIQWILISVVTVLPVLIPLAVVIFFLVRHNKKKKKQKSSQIQAETQIMPTSDVTTKSENN
ncbi:MAG: DUF4349 domain-containing protein, partial [Oscillospiraceae bacterium]|nr:DUF4349 domain-containing protein [Oscillospiraceae bacterium]